MTLAELLVSQSPDAAIFADREGVIREWNAAAERIFGHAAGEAIGRSLDIIVPERFRPAHWRGYERAIGEGSTKYSGQSLPTRADRKDGSQIYVELTFAIIHDFDGQVIGALAHARDITERWEEERRRRQRLRELEEQLRGETGA